jgi:hypothetical protein
MPLKPLNDRVLIRRIEEPEQRIGSIIVPDIAKMRAIKGEVVAVGRGKWHPGEWWYCKDGEPIDGKQPYDWCWIPSYREPPPVFAGQTVYFNSKWSDMGDEYQHPGVGWDETLHLVMIGDIFAIAN